MRKSTTIFVKRTRQSHRERASSVQTHRFSSNDYVSPGKRPLRRKKLPVLTTSHNRAAQLGTVPLYQWGMMRTPREEGAQWSVFVEVALEKEPERIKNGSTTLFDKSSDEEITIGTTIEGTYLGSRLRGVGFDQCFHDVFHMAEKMDGALIATEVWTDELDPRNYIVELLEKQ
ncbi:MAG: hypothetical protein ACLTQI_06350 [Slackia sp.]